MNTPNFSINQKVSYKNGNQTIHAGTIVKINKCNTYTTYVVIDENDSSAMQLFTAGYAIGTEIAADQILN